MFQTTKFFFIVVRTRSELFTFFLWFCHRRRIGLTVFFMGALLYALFLITFSHYLYCGHYFMNETRRGDFMNETRRGDEVFEVSGTNCYVDFQART